MAERSKDYDTEYDVSEVQVDPRFESCRRDMVIITTEYFGTLILAFILVYALSPSDISEMRYLFGLPVWAVSAALVLICSAVFAVIYTLKSKTFSLEAKATDEEVDF